MSLLVLAPTACLRHDPGDHPESPERLRVLLERALPPEPGGRPPRAARAATLEDLLLCHDRGYVEAVRRACESGFAQLDPDTFVSSGSFEAALAAAGAAIDACDAVLDGASRRAFCAIRPPGHHALEARSMGYCLFNNVAIAARHLLRRRGIGRVLVVDFDVHHGNGTEALLAADEGAFFWSLHRWPFWPGSGGPDESDRPTFPRTVNTPLPATTTPATYLQTFDAVLASIERRFVPEFVLVSAGFDAFEDDPVGGLNLRPEDFFALTRRLVALAEARCGGRLVSLLEGGYSHDGLVRCVREHLKALG